MVLIEATMMAHKAKWQKTCCLKFNQTKLDQIQKKTNEPAGLSSPMQTRSLASKNEDRKQDLCFFCDEPAGSVGHVPMILMKRLENAHWSCKTQPY